MEHFSSRTYVFGGKTQLLKAYVVSCRGATTYDGYSGSIANPFVVVLGIIRRLTEPALFQAGWPLARVPVPPVVKAIGPTYKEMFHLT